VPEGLIQIKSCTLLGKMAGNKVLVYGPGRPQKSDRSGFDFAHLLLIIKQLQQVMKIAFVSHPVWTSSFAWFIAHWHFFFNLLRTPLIVAVFGQVQILLHQYLYMLIKPYNNQYHIL